MKTSSILVIYEEKHWSTKRNIITQHRKTRTLKLKQKKPALKNLGQRN